MKNSGRIFILLAATIFLSSILVAAQMPGWPTPQEENRKEGVGFTDVIPWLFAILAFIFGIYQYMKLNKRAKIDKLAEITMEDELTSSRKTLLESYIATLREKLGLIDIFGSPDIDSSILPLDEVFTSLSISEAWRSEGRLDSHGNFNNVSEHENDRHLSPDEVIGRAFSHSRLLLVIGDPGSGKTTLLKYYAMRCLDFIPKPWGFNEEVLPIFLPLRELTFDGNDEPVSLPESLEKMHYGKFLNIHSTQFNNWLREKQTLVLLDGLDEIQSLVRRRKVCRWIKDTYSAFTKAVFVVTSRATGYRKLDGIELQVPHLRADILDFSPGQQEEFLRKWFHASLLSGLPVPGISHQEWKRRQSQRAEQQADTIIRYLKRDENIALRDLVSVPILLQILALIWHEMGYKPRTRGQLLHAALNYLLSHRDMARDISPLLVFDDSRRVLKPFALWMQEILRRDEAEKNQVHAYMQPHLDTLPNQPNARDFCRFLRERAGLIIDYDGDHYIFRHRSFREFLAAEQLKKEASNSERIERIVSYFSEPWWEETLRFFMGNSDDAIFDEFMNVFFRSKISLELDSHQRKFLLLLVREAPQKRLDALVRHLNSDGLNGNQKRYILDCLKTIGTPGAIKAISGAKSGLDESNRSYAEDIIAEASALLEKAPPAEIPQLENQDKPSSFRNPFEFNVEYSRIPGGTYLYSATHRMETVPDFYLCKYPVTNKQYCKFISFLEGNEKELAHKLPQPIFAKKLFKFAAAVEGYKDYLGEDSTGWASMLHSRLHEDTRFNGEDQPVVAVSWYAARAYCFWLSCLEAVSKGAGGIENMDALQLASIYRLPTEREWEWAAGGNPDGTTREHPWSKEKGESNPKLANYDKNVGATTPVGSYPEGATPLGLMDISGNTWEWMGNYYDADRDLYALRGGSWYDDDKALSCTARSNGRPEYQYDVMGFRVLRTQP